MQPAGRNHNHYSQREFLFSAANDEKRIYPANAMTNATKSIGIFSVFVSHLGLCFGEQNSSIGLTNIKKVAPLASSSSNNNKKKICEKKTDTKRYCSVVMHPCRLFFVKKNCFTGHSLLISAQERS